MSKFDILLVDPPWPYYGSPSKNAAAGKHYDLMSQGNICALDVRSILSEPGAVFLWATSPKMDLAIEAIKSWGLNYRGIAFVWIKTRLDGKVIHGQGVPATCTKPTTEYVLLATTNKRGRPFTLLDHGHAQVFFAPRGAHSAKPKCVRDFIVSLYGDRPRAELFARGDDVDGWRRWGNEVDCDFDFVAHA